MTDRALVKNAASTKQVLSAAKREKLRRAEELADLSVVMGTVQGRRFIWRLLTHANVFSSVMRDGVERVMYLAGRQDTGHFVMAEVLKAGEALYLQMQREAYAGEAIELDVAEHVQGKATTEETDNPESGDDAHDA